MMPQVVGMHRSGPYKAKASGITYSRGQSPAAAPNHPSLNNGILNPKKFTNSVFHNDTKIMIKPAFIYLCVKT
jgi:hypothetical protein